MGPANKHYPSPHLYRRPWNYSDYLRGTVEEELIQCKKSVYLEKNNQLEFQYMSENYPKKGFYYLKYGRYPSKVSAWGFHNLHKSRVPVLFSLYLQCGIYHELHKLNLLEDQLKRKSITTEIFQRNNERIILDMTSSVQTIFIVFCGMVILATLTLAFECRYFIFYKLEESFRKCRKCKFPRCK